MSAAEEKKEAVFHKKNCVIPPVGNSKRPPDGIEAERAIKL